MTRREPYRLSFWKGFFYLLVSVGLVLAVVRFTQGIGAVSNLSDTYPWGIWVGFDVLCGIGLAAGGFILTGVVYVFNVKRFRPIVRATILTAFLGYLLEVIALFFDLGRPWNLWHPLIMWNPRSPLFAVSWCVTVYTAVLALEFSGIVFERLAWTRAIRIQQAVSVPLVILGVLISVVHQSTLGALYLIVPGKLHALWYSPMLPWLFLVSSIAVGLAMTIVESRLSARIFKRQLELPLLTDLGRALAAILAVYGVMRLFDLWDRDVLGLAFSSSYEARMLQLEIAVGILLPGAILAVPRARLSGGGLYVASLAAIAGFMLNRLNVSITGLESALGGHYLPSWSEVFITLMIVALGFAAFGLAVRYLNVYPEETAAAPAAPAAPGPLAARRIVLQQERT